MDWIKFITEDLPIIVQNIFMVVGALKVLSRYTPWKWDDKIFEFFEIPFNKKEDDK